MDKTLLFIFSFFPDSFVPQHIFSSSYVSGTGDRLVPTIGEVTLLQETSIQRIVSIMYVRAQSLQSCPTLNSTGRISPFSSIHGIFPAKTLEWVAMPSSRGSSRPRDRTHISYISCIAGRFFTSEPPGEAQPVSHWQANPRIGVNDHHSSDKAHISLFLHI